MDWEAFVAAHGQSASFVGAVWPTPDAKRAACAELVADIAAQSAPVAALDALRVVLRERVGLEPVFAAAPLRRLTELCESADVELAGLALRCLHNCVFCNEPLLPLLQAEGLCARVVALLGRSLPVPAMSLVARTVQQLSPLAGFGQRAVNEYGVLQLSVPLLAWTFRRPGFAESAPRTELAGHLLNMFFALGEDAQRRPAAPDSPVFASMTQLGVLLAHMLLCPHTPTRLAVVRALMNMPEEYAAFLRVNGGLPSLGDLLDRQLELVAVERPGQATTEVAPLLIVLSKVCDADAESRAWLRAHLWPPAVEAAIDERARARIASYEGLDMEAAKKLESDARMHPGDNTPGTARARLCKLMTSFDAGVARYAAELVMAICGQDKNDFVRLAGYGNAIGLLKIRGVL